VQGEKERQRDMQMIKMRIDTSIELLQNLGARKDVNQLVEMYEKDTDE